MAINSQFGDLDARGATIRAPVASVVPEHPAIVRHVLAPGGLGGGAHWVSGHGFITGLGRNVRMIYGRANSTGNQCRLPAATWARPKAPSVPTGRNCVLD